MKRMKLPDSSWEDFSTAAGLSKDTVRRLIRKHGKTKTMRAGNPETLHRLASHYSVRSAWLIDGDGDPFGDDELERLIARNSNSRKFTPLILALARMIRDSEPGRSRPADEWIRVLRLLVKAVEAEGAQVAEEPQKSTIRKV